MCPAQFVSLPCGGVGVDSDTVWNEQNTAESTRMVRFLLSYITNHFEDHAKKLFSVY